MVPMTDLAYDYEDIVALGIGVDDDTGAWLVPYDVLFPLGSTLDRGAEGISSQGTPLDLGEPSRAA